MDKNTFESADLNTVVAFADNKRKQGYNISSIGINITTGNWKVIIQPKLFWKDRCGKYIALEDMSKEHLINALKIVGRHNIFEGVN